MMRNLHNQLAEPRTPRGMFKNIGHGLESQADAVEVDSIIGEQQVKWTQSGRAAAKWTQSGSSS